MTNLDSILKSRDITLPTKVRLVKALIFPVVMRLVMHDHKLKFIAGLVVEVSISFTIFLMA